MRRIAAVFLMLALSVSLFAACGQTDSRGNDVQPISFYYRTRQLSYDDSGVIAPQVYDLGEEDWQLEQIVERYLTGCQDEALESPFPPGTALCRVEQESNADVVVLSREFAALHGMDLSIAAACLAMTLFQCNDGKAVQLYAEGEELDGREFLRLTPEQIVLSDIGASASTMDLQLYFASGDGRYLLPETRSVTFREESELPEYLLRQLLEGPKSKGLSQAIPANTVLLDIGVTDGVCVVELSAEFADNAPQSAQGERLAVFSIVNTLTQLDAIHTVIFLTEGTELTQYRYLNLSAGLVRDESLIGREKDAAQPLEFDATVYLGRTGQSGVFACPMWLTCSREGTKSAAIVQTLLTYTGCNGYESPLHGAGVHTVTVSGGVCTVDFAADPFVTCETAEQVQRCLDALTLSLCSQEEVQSVKLLVDGQKPTSPLLQIPETLTPNEDAVCE